MAIVLALLLADELFVVRKTVPFVLVWWFFYQQAAAAPPSATSPRRLARAVTQGEWLVVSSLASVALTELLTATTLLFDSSTFQQQAVASHDDDTRYAHVAATGLAGCALACVLVNAVGVPSQTRTSAATVLVRLVFMAAIALGTVEVGFWRYADRHHELVMEYYLMRAFPNASIGSGATF